MKTLIIENTKTKEQRQYQVNSDFDFTNEKTKNTVLKALSKTYGIDFNNIRYKE